MRKWNVLGGSLLGFGLGLLALGSACGGDDVVGGAGSNSPDSGGETGGATGTGGATNNTGGTKVDAGSGGSSTTDAAAGGSDASANPDTGVPGTGGTTGDSAPPETDAGLTDAPVTFPDIGASDGSTPGLLCSFDLGNLEAGVSTCSTWAASNNGDDGVISYIQDEAVPGNSTTGALQFVTHFSTRENVRIRADFTSLRDWSSLKSLHAFVKVVNPGDARSIELGVRVGPLNNGDHVWKSYDISTFTVGQFKELTFDISSVPANDRTQINRMGVQITPKGSDAGQPDGGRAEATLVIDQIWVD